MSAVEEAQRVASSNGKTVWIFPDAELPAPVQNGSVRAHEALLVLNVNDVDADLEIDLFWSDTPPTRNLRAVAHANRVTTLYPPFDEARSDALVPVRTQYAIRVRSSIEVVCQLGRIEAEPNAYSYTTLGYSHD